MRMKYMLFLPAALTLLAFASVGNAFVPPERAPAAESETAEMRLETTPPTRASDIKVSPASVEGLVQAFVEDRADLLGVDMDRLRLVRQEKHGARWYTNYQQVYEGLDVIGGKVHVRLRENGTVTVFGSDFFRDLTISTVPTLSDAEAILRAKTDTEFDFTA